MKFIVTGANGFIGSSLIKKLVEHSHEVVAIDISFSNDKLGDNPLITKIECSLDKLDAGKLPTMCDAFYHLAWQGVNGLDKANPIVQIHNVELTLKCAYLAKLLNCKKFLCSGTIAEKSVESLENLNKTSGGMMYGTAKHCAHLMLETYCKNIGLNYVWMQFSNIYGPNNKTGNLVSYTLSEVLNGQEALFGPAIQPYDFVFIDDLIEAVYRLGAQNTRENFYYIGSGNPRLLKEYLYIIGEKCNKEELIKINIRPDDGIKYSFDMFNCDSLIRDIGKYISGSFEEKIEFTIKNF